MESKVEYLQLPLLNKVKSIWLLNSEKTINSSLINQNFAVSVLLVWRLIIYNICPTSNYPCRLLKRLQSDQINFIYTAQSNNHIASGLRTQGGTKNLLTFLGKRDPSPRTDGRTDMK